MGKVGEIGFFFKKKGKNTRKKCGKIEKNGGKM